MKTLIILLTISLSSKLLANESIQSVVGYMIVSSYDMESRKKDKLTSSGSGIVLEHGKEHYFATNAHVCLGKYLKLISQNKDPENKDYKAEIQNAGLDYFIILNKNPVLVSTSLSKLKYDLNQDVCLIELPKQEKAYKLNDKVISLANEPKAIFYTYNKSPKKIKIKKGKLQFVLNDEEIPSILKSKDTKENVSMSFKMTEQAAYTFKAVPGDSGSPVFNEKKEFIGLVCSQVLGTGTTFINNKNEIIKLLSK